MGYSTQHWVNHYIGLPYRKYNCFQLVQKVLREVYQKDLPTPTIDMSVNIGDLSEAIDNLICNYVEPDQLQEPIDGCMVLMHGARNYNHIGLYLDLFDEGYCLHAFANARQSVCHRLSDVRKFGFEIEGYYQWL